MRLRRRTPLLLLLLPALAASVAVDTKAQTGSVAATDRSHKIDSIIPTKPDKGTKDAPVDGLDGKPHAGPFVYDPSEKKKLESKVEDLSSSKFSDEIDKAREGGWDIPERVDSVMTDRDGQRKGKTDGTEGGMSEKERKKAESGGKEEKKPAGPKEVLDHHEHEKEKVMKGGAKDGSSSKSSTSGEKKEKSEKGVGGLEVCGMSIITV